MPHVLFLMLMSILVLLLVTGCAQTKIVDTGCQWTTYITAHPDDTLETKRQILAHDLTRKEKCE